MARTSASGLPQSGLVQFSLSSIQRDSELGHDGPFAGAPSPVVACGAWQGIRP